LSGFLVGSMYKQDVRARMQVTSNVYCIYKHKHRRK